MTDIAKLIERVEAATGPDEAIDAAIAAAFRIHWTSADHWINRSPELEFRPADRDGWLEIWMPGEASPRDKWRANPYTASIDSALGLVDRLLGVNDPALCYSYDLGWHCSAHASMAYTADLHLAVGDPAKMETVHGQAHTQPLAILAALLRALSARSP